MKRVGIVSYNIYCNFTNYGSALQSWALSRAILNLHLDVQPVLVDYCPDVLADKNPLDPFKNMWDKDEQSQRMCRLTMPAIRENYKKFDAFYRDRFDRTSRKYTSENFNSILENEKLDGFVCGSDTIFCVEEFKGFDDGYYANYPCMRGRSVSYAASFGDYDWTHEQLRTLNERLTNFKALGIREHGMVPYLREHVSVPVAKTLDPTLTLHSSEYDALTSPRLEDEKYLLIYTRRYNPDLERYAQALADKNGWKIVEISLRATNAEKGHRMMYQAGVEEFLSLVKHAEYVVTNSFHGMLFSIQFRKQFAIFSREQGDTKIAEIISAFDLGDNMMSAFTDKQPMIRDYERVHKVLETEREKSLQFLKEELLLL